ncbi:MAG: enoyl-CoA hydratase, partial [Thauera phenolivorans]|nr:enoyl-CoA hydratase [Thauera phenolivorans]
MTLPPLTDALLALEDRVATLTLNRHDVRNALTGTALIDDIVAVADWINRCDAVSVLVITGAGSAFSAGGNVKDMAARGGDFAGDVAEVATRYRRGIQRIPLALQAVEVPIIAAVNGPAIGAGFDLANMADIRVA